MNQIEEQKNLLLDNGDTALAETLDKISQSASNSESDLKALNAIVYSLTAGGNDLGKSIDKLVYYFEQYKNIAKESTSQTNILISTYGKLGNSDKDILKISHALKEVKELQKDMNINFQLKGIDGVSVLTRQIMKLKNTLKGGLSLDVGNLPKFASGGKVTGGASSGDKILARLNAGEWVFNKRQMDVLSQMLSKDGKRPSHEEIFKMAGGNVGKQVVGKGLPMFAYGGAITDFSENRRKNITDTEIRFESGRTKNTINQRIDRAEQEKGGSRISQSDLKTLEDYQKLLIELREEYGSLSKDQKKVFELDITKLDSFQGVQEEIERVKELKQAYEELEDEVNSFETASARQIADMGKNILATAGDNKQKQATGRSLMKIASTHDDIQKSGNKTAINRANALQAQLAQPNVSPKQIKDIEKEYRKLFSELEKGQMQVAGFENALGGINKQAEDMANQFNDFFGGTPVGMAAVAAGVALVGKAIYDMSEKLADAMVQMSKMNQEMQTLQRTSKNAFGYSAYIENFRNNMSLTRQEIARLAPTMVDFTKNGNKGLSTLNTLAANIKENFGTLDIKVFEDAMKLLQDLPEQQIQVLMGVNDDSMDKMNTLTNILQNGKLDATIDLYEKGAFGEVEGVEGLSQGDKALLESQKQMTKFLEDIKFTTFDFLGTYKGVVPMIAKIGGIAAGVAGFALGITKGVMALNKLAHGAIGQNPVPVRDINGGNGGGGNNLDLKGGGKGFGAKVGNFLKGNSVAIAGIGGQLVTSVISVAFAKAAIKAAQKADVQKKMKYEKEMRKTAQVGFSKMEVTSPDMERVAAQANKTAATYAMVAGTIATTGLVIANVAGAISTASMSLGATAATIGAQVAGVAAFSGSAGAVGYKVGQERELKRQLGDDWKESGYFTKDENGEWKMDQNFMQVMIKQNQVFKKESAKADKKRKQMLEDMKGLRNTEALLKQIKNGVLTSYSDKSYEVAQKNIKSLGAMGGSDVAFSYNVDKAMSEATNSYATNISAINKAREDLFKNEKISAEARNVELNRIQEQQAEIVQKFVDSVMSSIGQYEKIPGIILNNIQNAIDKRSQDFQTKGRVGTADSYMQKSEAIIKRDMKSLQAATTQLIKDEKKRKQAIAKAEEKVQQANTGLDNLSQGSVGTVVESTGYKKYLDRNQERLSRMLGGVTGKDLDAKVLKLRKSGMTQLGGARLYTSQEVAARKKRYGFKTEETNVGQELKAAGIDVSKLSGKSSEEELALVATQIGEKERAMFAELEGKKLFAGDAGKLESRQDLLAFSKTMDESARKYDDKDMFKGGGAKEEREMAVQEMTKAISDSRQKLSAALKTVTTQQEKDEISAQLASLAQTEKRLGKLKGTNFGTKEVQAIFKLIKGSSDISASSFNFEAFSDEQKKQLAAMAKAKSAVVTRLNAGNTKNLEASSQNNMLEQYSKILNDNIDNLNNMIRGIDANPTVVAFNDIRDVIEQGKDSLIAINGSAETMSQLWGVQISTLEAQEKQIAKAKQVLADTIATINKNSDKFTESKSQSVKDYVAAEKALLQARMQATNNPTEENQRRVAEAEARVNSFFENTDVQSFRDSTEGRALLASLGQASDASVNLAKKHAEAANAAIKLMRSFNDAYRTIEDMSSMRNLSSRLSEQKTNVDVGAEMYDRGAVTQASKKAQALNAQMRKTEMAEIKKMRQKQIKEQDRLIAEQEKKVVSVTGSDKVREQKKLDAMKLERSAQDAKYREMVAQKELEYKKQVGEIAAKERDAKLSMLDTQEQMLNTQLDLANEIGAPYETILMLERKQVEFAKQKYAEEEAALRNMQQNGATTKQIEEQKLRVAKAGAQVAKAAMGAQRSAMEKLMGNMIGSFTQVAGIMGPGNKAAMFGQGYVQGQDGNVIGRGANMGYQERVARANKSGGKDPYSGETYNAGGGAKRSAEVGAVATKESAVGTLTEAEAKLKAMKTYGASQKDIKEQEAKVKELKEKEQKGGSGEQGANNASNADSFKEEVKDEKDALEKILAWVKKISSQIENGTTSNTSKANEKPVKTVAQQKADELKKQAEKLEEEKNVLTEMKKYPKKFSKEDIATQEAKVKAMGDALSTGQAEFKNNYGQERADYDALVAGKYQFDKVKELDDTHDGQEGKEVVVQGSPITVNGESVTMNGEASDLWSMLADGAVDMWNGIKDVAGSVWDFIKESGASIWDAMKELGIGMWDGIKSVADTVWEGIKGVPDMLKTAGENLMNFFADPKKFMQDIGTTIGETFVMNEETSKGLDRVEAGLTAANSAKAIKGGMSQEDFNKAVEQEMKDPKYQKQREQEWAAYTADQGIIDRGMNMAIGNDANQRKIIEGNIRARAEAAVLARTKPVTQGDVIAPAVVAQPQQPVAQQTPVTKPEATTGTQPQVPGGKGGGKGQSEVLGTIKVQVEVTTNDSMFESKVKNILIQNSKKVVMQGMTGQ